MRDATPITFRCSCGQKLKAAATVAGRQLKCPACGDQTTVPLSPPPEPEPVIRNVFYVAPTYDVVSPVDELPPRVIKRRRRPPYRLLAAIITGAVVSVIACGGIIAYRLMHPAEARKMPRAADLSNQELGAIAQLGYEHVKPHVLNALKAPTTAVFSKTFDYEAQRDDVDNRVKLLIQADVDAQNEMGVPLRNRIVGGVVLDLDTAEWQIVTLYLDDLHIAGELLGGGPREFREVRNWSGRGDELSEEFKIYSDWWRYLVTSEADDVEVAVIDAELIPLVTAEVGPGRSRTVRVDAKGTFRLRIRTKARWTVTVEEPL